MRPGMMRSNHALVKLFHHGIGVILVDSVAVMNMWPRIVFPGLFLSVLANGQALNCDLQGYKAQDGLKAEMRAGVLTLTWQGERGQTLRALLGVVNGQPTVKELAVEKNGTVAPRKACILAGQLAERGVVPPSPHGTCAT